MPLGIVSADSFAKELNNLIKGSGERYVEPEVNVVDINRGRGNKKETPEIVRAIVATEALSGASPEVLEKEFGVSKSSISAYKVGATSTSTYNQPDKNLKGAIDEVRARVIGPAQERLIQAIEAITPEKLNESGLKVVSGVARDMSAIIKNMEPEVGQQNNVQVNVFRPRERSEDTYEVIAVNE